MSADREVGKHLGNLRRVEAQIGELMDDVEFGVIDTSAKCGLPQVNSKGQHWPHYGGMLSSPSALIFQQWQLDRLSALAVQFNRLFPPVFHQVCLMLFKIAQALAPSARSLH